MEFTQPARHGATNGGSLPSGINKIYGLSITMIDKEKNDAFKHAIISIMVSLPSDVILQYGYSDGSYTSALRLRGGTNNPNVSKYEHEIPYLKSIHFMWNGLPHVDFTEKIAQLFRNGLGSITQGDYSLLATVDRIDRGGTRSATPYAACTQNEKDQHDRRKEKAFHCIMNYIDSRSEIYHFLMVCSTTE